MKPLFLLAWAAKRGDPGSVKRGQLRNIRFFSLSLLQIFTAGQSTRKTTSSGDQGHKPCKNFVRKILTPFRTGTVPFVVTERFIITMLKIISNPHTSQFCWGCGDDKKCLALKQKPHTNEEVGRHI